MKGVRAERLAEQVRQILADILISRAEDPRLRMLLVTRVDLSPDLSSARVYISALGEEAAQEASVRAISRARSFLRGELARRARLRRTPELTFLADPGIRASLRLQQMLQELGLSDEGSRPPGEDGEKDE